MNITEALDVALPDIPVLSVHDRPPKLHPDVVAKEHLEDGAPIISAVLSGKPKVCRFTPVQWQLAQLFDGTRESYEEILRDFAASTGARVSVDDLRGFVDTLESMEFWYKSPIEENITLFHKLKEGRGKRVKRKSRWGDLSRVAFPGWDPDKLFGKIYPYVTWMYSGWFTALTLIGFVFMIYVWGAHWHQYWEDTLEWFNLTNKSFRDFAEFYLLTVVVLFIHESAHGVTCKRYGAHVHDMGFQLIYMAPAFYVDATEAYVYAEKWQRIRVVVAGVWSELIICAIATPIWVGTPPGSWAHELCYKLMLLTGAAVIVINWNPLVPMDGYFILSELLEMHDLRQNASAYLSAWVRKNVFHLPAEVPYVPKKRRPVYAVYAFLAGLYGYVLLYFFSRWIGNMVRVSFPQWAFLGTTAVALLLFRGRIRTFVRFMRMLYLDKKDWIRSWLTPPRTVAAVALLLILLLVPLLRESTMGRFVLEPQNSVELRTLVPGTVVAVYADEGQPVAPGEPLARLRNLGLEGDASKAAADFRVASARATRAQLRYGDFGRAEHERQQLQERSSLLAGQVAKLSITSPITGVVVTPRVHDRLGSYLEAGTKVAEVADVRTMRARMYVPEFDVRRVQVGAPARLQCDCSLAHLDSVVASISLADAQIEPGVVEIPKYKGMRPPNFYEITLLVRNPDGVLKAGMTGTGKILGPRHGLLVQALRPVWEFVAGKIW
ncbi:MAG: HlyD family efflux transporter periplasmic adaptor subunit [Terriglobales bacterium]